MNYVGANRGRILENFLQLVFFLKHLSSRTVCLAGNARSVEINQHISKYLWLAEWIIIIAYLRLLTSRK